MRQDTVPVTILSGSLGAGKTTLLNHLLRNAGDRTVAVLVNDMGEVNVDAELVAEGSDLDVEDGVAELSNGCICCELQDDLETAVTRLARQKDFDVLVVEASGISEPEPVARLFTTSSRAAALYRVDALVTVVDTPFLLQAFDGRETVERAGEGEDGTRPLSDLVVEQVEFSNVVLLNKTDRCSPDELDRAETLVRALQPAAEVVRTEFSAVDPDRILDVGLFDPDETGELAGWKRALADDEDDAREGGDGDRSHEGRERGHGHGHSHADHDHDHRGPAAVYGVSSTTYRRRRPLHPGRFAAFLRELPPGVVRAKGTCFVAGRDDLKLGFSQVGRSVRVEGLGPWVASLPEFDRELYRSNRPELDWDERWGDRRTELVFIGTDFDPDGLAAALDDCLLSEAELEGGDYEGAADDYPSEPEETAVFRE